MQDFMQVSRNPVSTINGHDVKSGTQLYILCYGGTVARYIARVHDKNNSLCVWQILAELFAYTRVTRNID
jgi:hypothetical protein